MPVELYAEATHQTKVTSVAEVCHDLTESSSFHDKVPRSAYFSHLPEARSSFRSHKVYGGRIPLAGMLS